MRMFLISQLCSTFLYFSLSLMFPLFVCFHSIYVYLEGRFWENSELIFFWAWKIKARSAGGLEELNPGNPQSTGEGEDEHKHTLITNQVEEANVHLLKSAEIGVGVPEVLYATSICKCQGTSTSSWLQINDLGTDLPFYYHVQRSMGIFIWTRVCHIFESVDKRRNLILKRCFLSYETCH